MTSGSVGTPSSGGSSTSPSSPSSPSSSASPTGNKQSDNAAKQEATQATHAAGAGDGQPAPSTPQQAFAEGAAKGLAQAPIQPSAMSQVAQSLSAPMTPADPQTQAPVHHSAGATSGPSGGGSSSGGVPGGFSGGGGGGGGGTSGGFGGSSTPAMPPPMPLPPATPQPPGPTAPGAGGSANSNPAAAASQNGPGVNPASTSGTTAMAGPAPAPIPVSSTRMERDAIAAASAAGALRRQKNNGNDALTRARRIGAALNVGNLDFGFIWVTYLCADGTIVVANSYGLAYIPRHVSLPEQIRMASADDSIPIADRAKWVTYPILAIQGWAQAHSQKLRAIIATEAQFEKFDPGAAKVILRPDDIPDNGQMEGRSRLEVIAPEAAARLSSVSDAGLVELLPPAPADINAPEDTSARMWFEMAMPLMTTSADRGIGHLELFVKYADHAQELALFRAHTATDGNAQREAIADWVYWQHLSVLMTDALSESASV